MFGKIEMGREAFQKVHTNYNSADLNTFPPHNFHFAQRAYTIAGLQT